MTTNITVNVCSTILLLKSPNLSIRYIFHHFSISFTVHFLCGLILGVSVLYHLYYCRVSQASAVVCWTGHKFMLQNYNENFIQLTWNLNICQNVYCKNILHILFITLSRRTQLQPTLESRVNIIDRYIDDNICAPCTVDYC